MSIPDPRGDKAAIVKKMFDIEADALRAQRGKGAVDPEDALFLLELANVQHSAIKDAVQAIKGLVGQQAMPDDFYVPTLERLEKML